MGFDPIAVEYTDLKCSDCMTRFSELSSTGPVSLCLACVERHMDEILADDCGHHVLPVPGDRVSCGLRKDLSKDERHHEWVSLGIDVRHFDDGFLMEAEVFACMECGADKMKSTRPKPKVESAKPKFSPEVKAQRDAFRRLLFDAGVTGDERKRVLADYDRRLISE
jgi:hypothetical protein